jgi:hypothetical protein
VFPSTPYYASFVCFLLRERGIERGGREGHRERIDLPFVFFEERRREGEKGTHRERVDLPFVFFKEGRSRRRRKKRGVSLPLFKGFKTDYPCGL